MTDVDGSSDAAVAEEESEGVLEEVAGGHIVEECPSGSPRPENESPGVSTDGLQSTGAGGDETQNADPGRRKLRIAIAGCAHGEMDKIYEVLAELEADKGYKFDLLICCGDYQAVRNYGDLHHMHVSEKYRSIQTFYKYYSGEKTAPVLTIFVGGNHEASGYLAELPNGGWVAPNIYYMGFANVIRFAGLRIAGLSGIFNGKEFNRGHYERPPYTERGDVISSYHVRNLDVWRLKQLRPADGDNSSNPIDIMVSHDWPAGIVDFGDKQRLLKIKPFFVDDVNNGKLGNPSTMQLLYDMRPKYWFAAHLHVGFAAFVPHESKDGSQGAEPTRFLALDKPIPRRHFIQSLELDIADDAELKLSYDPQWLAILKITDNFTSTSRSNAYLPSAHSSERWDFRPTEEELEAISKLGDLSIPENFQQTAKPLKEDTPEARKAKSSPYYRNPQSAEFCSWLGISDLNKMLVDMDPSTVGIAHYMVESSADDSEIQIDDDIFGDGEDFALDTRPTPCVLNDTLPPVLTPNPSTPKSVVDDVLAEFVPPKLTPKTPKDPTDDVLDGFLPPKITPKSSSASKNDDSFVFKRRKVDIPDDD